jgi:hypothetical protein
MADEAPPSTVFRDFRGTEGAIADADPAPPRKAGKKEVKPGQSVKGVGVKGALESERPPAEGEGSRAFGAPLDTTPPVTEEE